jgi:Lipid A 3-O-deacylase (PagL)
MSIKPLGVAVLVLGVAGRASADDSGTRALGSIEDTSSLRFDSDSAAAQSIANLSLDDALTPDQVKEISYGREGDSAWSISAGSVLLMQDADAYPHVEISIHEFLVDSFEIVGELGVWEFFQEGDDATGGSLSVDFRWHFWASDDWSESYFVHMGAGLLFTDEHVPEDGSSVNFLPRAGVGYTRQIRPDGTRFILNLRWQHVSNGRLLSGDENPGRDGLSISAGIIIPF